jgi:hypothetical protein
MSQELLPVSETTIFEIRGLARRDGARVVVDAMAMSHPQTDTPECLMVSQLGLNLSPCLLLLRCRQALIYHYLCQLEAEERG